MHLWQLTRAIAVHRTFDGELLKITIQLIGVADELELVPQFRSDMHRLQIPVSHLAKANDRRLDAAPRGEILKLPLHQHESVVKRSGRAEGTGRFPLDQLPEDPRIAERRGRSRRHGNQFRAA